MVLVRVDPSESGGLGLLLFYVTLLAAVTGTLSIAGVAYRVWIQKRPTMLLREVRVAFRHAAMFAVVMVASLVLSSQGLFTWWNLLALLATIGIVEYVFVSMEEHRRM